MVKRVMKHVYPLYGKKKMENQKLTSIFNFCVVIFDV